MKTEMMLLASEIVKMTEQDFTYFDKATREFTDYLFENDGLYGIKRLVRKAVEEELKEIQVQKKCGWKEMESIFDGMRRFIEKNLSKERGSFFQEESELISCLFPPNGSSIQNKAKKFLQE